MTPEEFLAQQHKRPRSPTGADARLAALGGVQGWEDLAQVAEGMDDQEWDVEMHSAMDEAVQLFTARIMAEGGRDWWGVRSHDGFWAPHRHVKLEDAERARDELTLAWLEGDETILVEGFKNTMEGSCDQQKK